MISEIFFSIKSTLDRLKELVRVRDANQINSAIAKVNSLLIASQDEALKQQSEIVTLTKRIRDLENQIMKTKHWFQEKSRYDLKEIAPSIFVYVLKENETGEPIHHICPNCYENGFKSILHNTVSRDSGWKKLKCFNCSFEVSMGEKKRRRIDLSAISAALNK